MCKGIENEEKYIPEGSMGVLHPNHKLSELNADMQNWYLFFQTTIF